MRDCVVEHAGSGRTCNDHGVFPPRIGRSRASRTDERSYPMNDKYDMGRSSLVQMREGGDCAVVCVDLVAEVK